MEIPAHLPSTAELFQRLFEGFFAQGGVARAVFGLERGCPDARCEFAGLTRVPFVIVCVEGTMRVAIMRGGAPFEMVLNDREALFMRSNTWIRCDHYDAVLYFRVTMDVDHTLFGMDEEEYDRACVRPGDQALQLYVCPRLPDQTVTALIRRMEDPPCDGVLGDAWRVSAVNLLIAELARLLEGNTEGLEGKAHATWLAVRAYLREHCALPLDRTSVAQAFRITPGHVSRLFKRYGTAGFASTLQQLRLKRARILLDSADMTVSEIAYRCGFSSPAYFTRVFRQNVGVTPGEYRRKVSVEPAP